MRGASIFPTAMAKRDIFSGIVAGALVLAGSLALEVSCHYLLKKRKVQSRDKASLSSQNPRFISQQQVALANPQLYTRVEELRTRLALFEAATTDPLDRDREFLIERNHRHKQYLAAWHELFGPLYLAMFDEDPAGTWCLLQSAGPDFQDHRPFVLKMLESRMDTYPSGFIQFLSTHFLNDMDIVMAKVNQGIGMQKRFIIDMDRIGMMAHDDPNVMLAILSKDPRTITSASNELLASPDFVGKACEIIGPAILTSPISRQTVITNPDCLVKMLRADIIRNSMHSGHIKRLVTDVSQVLLSNRDVAFAWLSNVGKVDMDTESSRRVSYALFHTIDNDLLLSAINDAKSAEVLVHLCRELFNVWNLKIAMAFVCQGRHGIHALELFDCPTYVRRVARVLRQRLECHDCFATWLLVENQLCVFPEGTKKTLNKKVGSYLEPFYTDYFFDKVFVDRMKVALLTLEHYGY